MQFIAFHDNWSCNEKDVVKARYKANLVNDFTILELKQTPQLASVQLWSCKLEV